MPSFDNAKQLRFIVTIADGTVITFKGFRAVADIDKAGGVQMSTLRARIYGVSQSDMNTVTTLTWKPDYAQKNTVQVIAIDGVTETLVFAGDIVNAWGDYRGMPDVFLMIQAQAAYYGMLEGKPPISIKGGIDVAIVMSRIARDLGLQFENNNVHAMITDVYLAGTLTQQARDLQQMCEFDMYLDDKVLAITNRYTAREGSIPLISAATGLIGYPTFDSLGVTLQTLFTPSITFGGKIKIETDITRAAGLWNVVSIAHNLESEKPGGAWFSTIRGIKGEFAVV